MCGLWDSMPPFDALNWQGIQPGTNNGGNTQHGTENHQESDQATAFVDFEAFLVEEYIPAPSQVPDPRCGPVYGEDINAVPPGGTNLATQYRPVDECPQFAWLNSNISSGGHPHNDRSRETATYSFNNLRGQASSVPPTSWTAQTQPHKGSRLGECQAIVPNEQVHFQKHHRGYHDPSFSQQPRSTMPYADAHFHQRDNGPVQTSNAQGFLQANMPGDIPNSFTGQQAMNSISTIDGAWSPINTRLEAGTQMLLGLGRPQADPTGGSSEGTPTWPIGNASGGSALRDLRDPTSASLISEINQMLSSQPTVRQADNTNEVAQSYNADQNAFQGLSSPLPLQGSTHRMRFEVRIREGTPLDAADQVPSMEDVSGYANEQDLLPIPSSEPPTSDASSPMSITSPRVPTSPSIPPTLYCNEVNCAAEFNGIYRQGNIARHKRLLHQGHAGYMCEVQSCSRNFRRQDARLKHYRKHHPELARAASWHRYDRIFGVDCWYLEIFLYVVRDGRDVSRPPWLVAATGARLRQSSLMMSSIIYEGVQLPARYTRRWYFIQDSKTKL
ncbi:hypothetical protein BU25DRAFT_417948 [Macroventuria anomochaeta]|uniref:Uncharacterized protein n=1 Tax=Macroventuria anomochaeta TaxID=301207 RepID=A0ACB6SE15_9PLEO|nr:uncharacterized protein BU25DRAFT_417948 [Macroventuria anomochaeta]KAF2632222.1 hypothetical protein BU25DRAFT_417948 [Macroventuria anomochaeta]